MKDSRTIGKFFKKKETKTVSVEFLDRLRPNTFQMSKTGRIQTSCYGTFSNILTKIISYDSSVKNSFKKIEYPLYPDKIGLLCEKIVDENYRIFKKPVSKKGFEDRIGYLDTSIYTDKVKGTQFEAAIMNFYMDEDDSFVIKLQQGSATLTKDEFNRNDLENFTNEFSLAIRVPLEEMELLAYQVKDFLSGFKNVVTGPMLSNRSAYERNCQTIFKDIVGDTEKIREVEIKLNQLSEEDKKLVMSGNKRI